MIAQQFQEAMKWNLIKIHHIIKMLSSKIVIQIFMSFSISTIWWKIVLFYDPLPKILPHVCVYICSVLIFARYIWVMVVLCLFYCRISLPTIWMIIKLILPWTNFLMKCLMKLSWSVLGSVQLLTEWWLQLNELSSRTWAKQKRVGTTKRNSLPDPVTRRIRTYYKSRLRVNAH